MIHVCKFNLTEKTILILLEFVWRYLFLERICLICINSDSGFI